MHLQAVVFLISYAVFTLENTHFQKYLLKITYGKYLGLELNYLQEEIE